MNINIIRFIDLFAGIGGFRYGLEKVNNEYAHISKKSKQKECTQRRKRDIDKRQIQLCDRNRSTTFRCVWSNEWDKYARQIYKKHYGECDERDIRTVPTREIPDHDLLCAGFPCQAFSVAGKRKGFEDTRGTLFFEIARIAKFHQPMFLLLENVKGLISHNKGKTLEIILDTLQELGYYTNYEIYNSKNYGVPQNRERIFFLCTHIKGLISDGLSQRMVSSERIITEWLFQILLNNLVVAKKLQGHVLKDWLLGYLVCQEIKRNPKLQEKNIVDGITIPMGQNLSLFGDSEVWQSIDTWLLKNLGGNYKELNKSIILMAIKEIIESKTYTYSRMFLAILLATVLLKKSSNHLWNEVLSNLVVVKEGTNYARDSIQTKEIVITESGTVHLTKSLQEFSKYFIVGHLGEEGGSQIFPIGENGETYIETNKKSRGRQVSNTISKKSASGMNARGTNVPLVIGNIYPSKGQAGQIFDTKGLSKAIVPAKRGGSAVMPIVANAVDCDGYLREMGIHHDKPLCHYRIRRLTPVECERLQGFPDNWTEGISDTQRYKCLGNAVTTNVVTAIGQNITDYTP